MDLCRDDRSVLRPKRVLPGDPTTAKGPARRLRSTRRGRRTAAALLCSMCGSGSGAAFTIDLALPAAVAQLLKCGLTRRAQEIRTNSQSNENVTQDKEACLQHGRDDFAIGSPTDAGGAIRS